MAMSQELIERNFKALADALKGLRQDISDEKKRTKHLDGLVAQQSQKIQELEQRLSIHLATHNGSGPTNRG